jgi:hypothetical protein
LQRRRFDSYQRVYTVAPTPGYKSKIVHKLQLEISICKLISFIQLLIWHLNKLSKHSLERLGKLLRYIQTVHKLIVSYIYDSMQIKLSRTTAFG